MLDFTTNPLVALYFACENKEGEVIVLAPGTNRIKNAYSDTITILSSLHRFTAEEKEELYKLVEDVDIQLSKMPEWNADNEEIDERFNGIKIIQRLLHVIKYEKPSFTDRLKKSSLVQDLIVHPFKDNPRIIRQDGVFAIKSLSKYNGIDNMRIKDKDDNTVIFHISQTHKILKELNLMGINRASLFPDIENIARHFKSIYESVL